MTHPTTEWRDWHGLQALYMGEIIVGRVAPTGGRRNGPRAIFNLHGNTACWVQQNSIEEARAWVEISLAHWLHQAGIR